jgi:hypothetical protein
MRVWFVSAGVLVIMLGTSACSTQTAKSDSPAAAVSGVPASSPLAKVRLGMNKSEVRKVLGSPDDENSYMTGKAFIPFYFGTDSRRASWYYKGMGRVVFADGNVFGGGTPEVIRLDHDPSESGVAR